RIFAETDGTPEGRPDFRRILERLRKVGYGSKGHMRNYEKAVLDSYRKYGIIPLDASMYANFKVNGRLAGFGILKPGRRYSGAYPQKDSPNWLVRDYNTDNGGKISPEYLEKFRNAAKIKAAAIPGIPVWLLGGELMHKYPPDWWSKEATQEAALDALSCLLGAFVTGVKTGNPNAMVAQGAPANMSPQGGIREIDILLSACKRQNVRFDVISIHPYRASPEIPILTPIRKPFLKCWAGTVMTKFR
ncbi:MAG: hypothetical protein PHV59_10450, partial [Victivallales bacterium]|nr:hypothetical protein [Victivallales bacterium]